MFLESFKGIRYFLNSQVEVFSMSMLVFFFTFIDSFPTVCWLCFILTGLVLEYLRFALNVSDFFSTYENPLVQPLYKD